MTRQTRLSRSVSIWLVTVLMVGAGAGAAAAGTVLAGKISGKAPLAVSQSILIDHTQFDENDVSSTANRRMVSVSDDRTAFTAAAEIATGDEVCIDVPLINYGKTDSSVLLTLEYPPQISAIAEPFWTEETYSKALADGTITRTFTPPVPTPATLNQEQAKNSTNETNVQPLTTVAISANSVPASGTNAVIPGAPPITARFTDLATMTTGLPGFVTITPQTTVVPASSTRPAGASGFWLSDVTEPTMIDNTIETADNPQWTSIASPNANTILVSYLDGAPNFHVMFTRSDDAGTTWLAPVTAVADVVTSNPSIVSADLTGTNIYISYYDDTATNLRFVKSTNGGAAWSIPTVVDAGPNVGQYNSMALDSTGNIYISYFDSAAGRLKIAISFNGGLAWINGSPDGGPLVGQWTDIAVDGSDNLFISYYDDANNALKVGRYPAPAGPWAIDTVDVAPGVDVGQYTSIATSGGNIYVSYYDATNKDLKLAKYNGAIWSVFTVDGLGGTDVGKYSSIAASGTDVVISYYDETNGNLKFAKSTNGGFTWLADPQIVPIADSTGDVGQYTSIALAGNSIYIAYRDETNSDLKFARSSAVYYNGTFTLDVAGDGTLPLDTVNFVLIDLDGDNNIDRMEISSDDTTYGEGTLTDSITTANEDELFNTSPLDLWINTYHFRTAFNSSLPATASVQALDWYSGTVTADLNADNDLLDAADIIALALTDTDSNGLYDTLDISTDDGLLGATTFGEGLTLSNGIAGLNDDERITATTDVLMSSYYTFTVSFDNIARLDANDARITAKTHYTGTFNLDTDGNGVKTDPTDFLNFCLTDTDSDGIYNFLDLSLDDTTYGEGGLLGNNIVSIAGDDEQMAAGAPADKTLGRYLFTVSSVTNPAGPGNDASITSKTWFTSDGFTGTPFLIDADGDGTVEPNEKVAWAISDTDSDGRYDMIDLSMNNTTFGEGNLTDNRVGLTDVNDEVSSLDDILIFGNAADAAPYFKITRLDPGPDTDAEDVGIKSPWYVGTFAIDINGDQIPETLDFVIVDESISEGIFNKINIDRNDDAAYHADDGTAADEVHVDYELILLGGMKIEVHFPTTGLAVTYKQGKITNVVQAGKDRWIIALPSQATVGYTQDNVRIKVVTPDTVPPGYYTVKGTFTMNKP